MPAISQQDYARAPAMRRAHARLLWLAVADNEGCGCEPASEAEDGKPWVAPLCDAARALGLGEHFDHETTAAEMQRQEMRP